MKVLHLGLILLVIFVVLMCIYKFSSIREGQTIRMGGTPAVPSRATANCAWSTTGLMGMGACNGTLGIGHQNDNTYDASYPYSSTTGWYGNTTQGLYYKLKQVTGFGYGRAQAVVQFTRPVYIPSTGQWYNQTDPGGHGTPGTVINAEWTKEAAKIDCGPNCTPNKNFPSQKQTFLGVDTGGGKINNKTITIQEPELRYTTDDMFINMSGPGSTAQQCPTNNTTGCLQTPVMVGWNQGGYGVDRGYGLACGGQCQYWQLQSNNQTLNLPPIEKGSSGWEAKGGGIVPKGNGSSDISYSDKFTWSNGNDDVTDSNKFKCFFPGENTTGLTKTDLNSIVADQPVCGGTLDSTKKTLFSINENEIAGDYNSCGVARTVKNCTGGFNSDWTTCNIPLAKHKFNGPNQILAGLISDISNDLYTKNVAQHRMKKYRMGIPTCEAGGRVTYIQPSTPPKNVKTGYTQYIHRKNPDIASGLQPVCQTNMAKIFGYVDVSMQCGSSAKPEGSWWGQNPKPVWTNDPKKCHNTSSINLGSALNNSSGSDWYASIDTSTLSSSESTSSIYPKKTVKCKIPIMWYTPLAQAIKPVSSNYCAGVSSHPQSNFYTKSATIDISVQLIQMSHNNGDDNNGDAQYTTALWNYFEDNKQTLVKNIHEDILKGNSTISGKIGNAISKLANTLSKSQNTWDDWKNISTQDISNQQIISFDEETFKTMNPLKQISTKSNVTCSLYSAKLPIKLLLWGSPATLIPKQPGQYCMVNTFNSKWYKYTYYKFNYLLGSGPTYGAQLSSAQFKLLFGNISDDLNVNIGWTKIIPELTIDKLNKSPNIWIAPTRANQSGSTYNEFKKYIMTMTTKDRPIVTSSSAPSSSAPSSSAAMYIYIRVGQSCSVDCAGTYSSWNNCSEECGSGIKKRTFTITQPAEFGGNQCSQQSGVVDVSVCNVTPCKSTCGYSEWTPQSTCEDDCQIVNKRMVLPPNTTKECTEPLYKIEKCNTAACNAAAPTAKGKGGAITEVVCSSKTVPILNDAVKIESDSVTMPYTENSKIGYKCDATGEIINATCVDGKWSLPFKLCPRTPRKPQPGPVVGFRDFYRKSIPNCQQYNPNTNNYINKTKGKEYLACPDSNCKDVFTFKNDNKTYVADASRIGQCCGFAEPDDGTSSVYAKYDETLGSIFWSNSELMNLPEKCRSISKTNTNKPQESGDLLSNVIGIIKNVFSIQNTSKTIKDDVKNNVIKGKTEAKAYMQETAKEFKSIFKPVKTEGFTQNTSSLESNSARVIQNSKNTMYPYNQPIDGTCIGANAIGAKANAIGAKANAIGAEANAIGANAIGAEANAIGVRDGYNKIKSVQMNYQGL